MSHGHPLQRIDSQIWLLAFLLGWQAAIVYRMSGHLVEARREARYLRALERDLDHATAAGNGVARTFVAPEHGAAEQLES